MSKDNDTTKQKKLRAELGTLLSEFRDDKGKLPYSKIFLDSPKGKRILQIAVSELNLEWSELEKLLEYHARNIQKKMLYHGISKKTNQRPKHKVWKDAGIAEVKKYY